MLLLTKLDKKIKTIWSVLVFDKWWLFSKKMQKTIEMLVQIDVIKPKKQ